MMVVPSTLHNYLKFEHEEHNHIVVEDPEPYALCNLVYLDL